jgi:hypothetical protein
MGAIAIAPSRSATVWAGTGESSTGGGENVPSSGVWRSTDAGVTWENPTGTAAFGAAKIAALAVHPNKPDVCWAATDIGVFRTVDGGAGWQHFAAAQPYSDICILEVGCKLWVFLAMSGEIGNRAVIVRIEDPEAPLATVRSILPDGALPAVANRFRLPVAPAGPGPRSTTAPRSNAPPQDAKLAPFALDGGVGPFIYAVWARDDDTLYGSSNSPTSTASAVAVRA